MSKDNMSGGDLPIGDDLPDFNLFPDDDLPVALPVALPIAGGDVPVIGGGDLPIAGGDLPVIGGGDLPIAGGDVPVIGGGDLPIAGGDAFNVINLPVNSVIRFDGASGSFIFKTIADATIRFRDTESEIRIKTPDDNIWIQWNSDDMALLGQDQDYG